MRSALVAAAAVAVLACAAVPVTIVDCGAAVGVVPADEVEEVPVGSENGDGVFSGLASLLTTTNRDKLMSQIAQTSGSDGRASNRPTPLSQHESGCSPQQ